MRACTHTHAHITEKVETQTLTEKVEMHTNINQKGGKHVCTNINQKHTHNN